MCVQLTASIWLWLSFQFPLIISRHLLWSITSFGLFQVKYKESMTNFAVLFKIYVRYRTGTCVLSTGCHDFKDRNTRSSADADKPARRVKRSVKVTRHGTIRYARYGFLLVCYSKFVLKTHSFWDIRLWKCCDLEIQVKGHSSHQNQYESIRHLGVGLPINVL